MGPDHEEFEVGADPTITDEEDSILRNVYYDTSHPASYSTVSTLAKVTHIKPDRVKFWLEGEEPYTLHRPTRKRFPRNSFRVYFPDELWQADLVDMQAYASENSGYRYILTCIDVFSKFAFARPVKKKTGSCVLEAIRDIITTSDRKPKFLMTDKGLEFQNKFVLDYLKSIGVNYYHSHNPDVKCGVVERLNRTIKSRMWKYFTHSSTHRYIDELQNFMTSYNSAKHSTIKMAPKDVNENNMAKVYEALRTKWNKTPTVRVSPDLTVGTHVRISLDKGAFGKGYEEGWSQEIFIIKRKLDRKPVAFVLEDQAGEQIQGSYYSHEIQKVRPTEIFKIEKVLRTKIVNGKKKYFVKFRGYPDKFNDWVDNLVQL